MNIFTMSLQDALRPACLPAFKRSLGLGREEYFPGLEEQGCEAREPLVPHP